MTIIIRFTYCKVNNKSNDNLPMLDLFILVFYAGKNVNHKLM